MSVDPRYLISLKGKSFVLFAGLLDLAHRSGLRAIETEILSISDPQSESWIVQATGTFRAADGTDVVWRAHGDANPANSQMRGAYLRHAETRSVARMLRLATNVGITAFEELGPDAGEEGGDDGERAAVPVQPGVAGPVANGVRGGSAAGRRAPAAARPPADAAPGTADWPPRCAAPGCDRFLTPQQRDDSLTRFGAIYCRLHQEQHEAAR